MSWQILWVEKWGLVVLFMGLGLVFRIGKKINPIKPLLIYLVVLGSISSVINEFHSSKELHGALHFSSLDQLLCLFSFLIFLLLGWNLTKALRVCAWVVCAGLAVSQAPRYHAFLMINPSMASTFVVLASGCHPLAFLAVLLTHSWTAGLSLTAGILWRIRRDLNLGVWVALTLGAIAVLIHGHIPDNSRFGVWTSYFSFWSGLNLNGLLVGTGIGTTRVWLPYTNFVNHGGDSVLAFVWAHNDWLQSLVELGVIGVGLASISAFKLFKRASEEDKSVILGYAVAMMSNMVCHWPLTALIGWDLIRRILKEKA